VVEYSAPAGCPQCGSGDCGVRDRHRRLIVDLKPVRGGLKRWVTRHKATPRFCRRCGCVWMADDYPAPPHKGGRCHKYGWTLCGWTAYVTVVLRQTNEATVEALGDFFGVPILSGMVSKLRSQAADHYRGTYESLLAALRGGRLVHVDETWANVKGADKRGYVWAFANPEVAVYTYSPTREGDTLRETLAGFRGVLVSEF
jgi:Transposase IS66 family